MDVKTIKPEDTDRWEQFERARAEGWFPENVIVAISEEWGGGEIWHAWFAVRGRMLEYSLELEQKIKEARLAEENVGTVLALCSDGFRWRQDQLEDFVAFYATGAYRADDPFSEMERKHVANNNISIVRTISRFAYFERKQGEVRPRRVNWYVRPPRDPFAQTQAEDVSLPLSLLQVKIPFSEYAATPCAASRSPLVVSASIEDRREGGRAAVEITWPAVRKRC